MSQSFMIETVQQLINEFDIAGQLISLTPHKIGHINDTYISTWSSGRFVHQKINSYVFKNIPQLMNNVVAVTQHLQKQIEVNPLAPQDKAVKLVPTKAGEYFIKDEHGEYWRTYDYVPNTHGFQICTSAAQAKEAAETCGRFQRYVNDLDPKNFYTIIPDFHSTPYRYQQLDEAINLDSFGRVKEVEKELNFVEKHKQAGGLIMQALCAGEIAWKVTHNDLKFNNVLFDCDTNKGVAVVDLDICMPGSLMFDFGDLVRNTSVPAAEDEVDLSKVFMSIGYFEALADGYLGQLADTISPLEWELMPLAPKILTLTIGLRFLTDHILGDKYFKINYPGHNLVRAKSQFKLVESMDEQGLQIAEVINRVRNASRNI